MGRDARSMKDMPQSTPDPKTETLNLYEVIARARSIIALCWDAPPAARQRIDLELHVLNKWITAHDNNASVAKKHRTGKNGAANRR